MTITKKRQMEIKVGITVIIAIFLLAVTIFTVEKFHFGDAGYPIEVAFNFVDAIKPQSDVVVGGGVKIGHVAGIVVNEDQVILKIYLKNDVKLPKNATFQILSKGVMGDKYLNVVAQKDTGEYIQPNERVQGAEPANIDTAFQRLGQVADSVKFLLGDPDVTGSFGELMKNFSQLSGRLDQLVKSNERQIDRGIKDISSAASTINRFSSDIEAITKNLDKLLSEKNVNDLDKSVSNIKDVAQRLDKQIAQIEAGKGTLGTLINDEKMAEDLKAVIKDIKENPWKLLWKK